jgi:4-hydroxybenzoate polyprenyltransferase
MNGEKTNNQEFKPKLSLESLFWSLRPANILIVALTQYAFYYFLFKSNISQFGIAMNLNGYLLYAFILTTLLITACGYLINDYVDFDSDLINNKKYRLSSQLDYLPAYFSLLIIGLLISIFIALKLESPALALFYLLASALLFLYSTHFKKIPLVGNVVVALFSASVILIFLIFESNFIKELQSVDPESHSNFFFTLLFYALFMFLLSLTREIIKDIEDVDGDRLNGDNTIAVINLSLAKTISIILSFALLLIEIYFVIKMSTQLHHLIGLILIIVPQILFLLQMIKASSKSDYNKTSKLAKINMVLGLFYLIILNSN